MSRPAPEEVPEGTEQFESGRYAVMYDRGAVLQGTVHDIWDTRLLLWRTGLRCTRSIDAVQDCASTLDEIRHPALVRVKEVTREWVLLESLEAMPFVITDPWPVQAAVDAVLELAQAVQAMHAAGHLPEGITAAHLLQREGQRFSLLPLACGPGNETVAATSLSLLLAGLVTGKPLESSYDDASALPGPLRDAHAKAVGHRPDLGEFVASLEAFDPDAMPDATAGPSQTRAQQITGEATEPDYAVAEKVRADALPAAPTPAFEPPPKPPDVSWGVILGTTAAVLGGLLALGAVAGLGFSTVQVHQAHQSALLAEANLSEALRLEEGAWDELQGMELDVEGIRAARAEDPISEGTALLELLEVVRRPPLSRRPEARVLAQRAERLEPRYLEALNARKHWRERAEAFPGSFPVGLGLAPAYEPIAGIDDPLE